MGLRHKRTFVMSQKNRVNFHPVWIILFCLKISSAFARCDAVRCQSSVLLNSGQILNTSSTLWLGGKKCFATGGFVLFSSHVCKICHLGVFPFFQCNASHWVRTTRNDVNNAFFAGIPISKTHFNHFKWTSACCRLTAYFNAATRNTVVSKRPWIFIFNASTKHFLIFVPVYQYTKGRTQICEA